MRPAPMASSCVPLTSRSVLERHLARRSRPGRGLDMGSGDDGRERWRLQAASAGGRDELVVVEELGVVNGGLLREEKGEEVEMRVKLGGRIGEEGAVGGGSAMAARRRGRRRTRRARCYRRGRVPRT